MRVNARLVEPFGHHARTNRIDTARQTLAGDEQIGSTGECLGGPHRAGTAETGAGFIHNDEHATIPAQTIDLRHEFWRGPFKRLVAHGLDDHGRGGGVEACRQIRRIAELEKMCHLTRQIVVARNSFICRICDDRRESGVAVIGIFACEYSRPPGCFQGDHDRKIDRGRGTVGDDRPVWKSRWHSPFKRLRDSQGGLVRQKPHAAVDAVIKRTLNDRNDLQVRMSEIVNTAA